MCPPLVATIASILFGWRLIEFWIFSWLRFSNGDLMLLMNPPFFFPNRFCWFKNLYRLLRSVFQDLFTLWSFTMQSGELLWNPPSFVSSSSINCDMSDRPPTYPVSSHIFMSHFARVPCTNLLWSGSFSVIVLTEWRTIKVWTDPGRILLAACVTLWINGNDLGKRTVPVNSSRTSILLLKISVKRKFNTQWISSQRVWKQ